MSPPSAMILAAGFGTRLRPLTDQLPKPLLPVGDRPAFRHAFDSLHAAGFSPIVMNTHHGASAFQGAVPGGLLISHEQEILGTAGGLNHARPLLPDGATLVWNGDVLAEPDLEGIRATWDCQGRDLFALLVARPRPTGEGTVGVSPSGHVARLRGHVFADEAAGADFLGIHLVSARARQQLPLNGCLVGDLYLPALARGELIAIHPYDGEWDDVGSPVALLDANLRWLRRTGREYWVGDRAVVPPAVTCERSVVQSGATIVGTGAVQECLVLCGAVLQAPARRVIAAPGGVCLSFA